MSKTLCILFKYLGDVAVSVPAMRALRAHRPADELHVLVAEEAAPIVRNLPWIHKVWAFPRKRGRAQFRETLPVLARLRRERFSRSVDFVGNDRGAIVSRIIGARERIGLATGEGFFGRRYCYTNPVPEALLPHDGVHESERHAHLLHVCGVPLPDSYELEVRANPSLSTEAARFLPHPAVIGHISTSQPKKEWAPEFWLELYQRVRARGVSFVFAAGPSPREQGLLNALRALDVNVPVLAPIPDLELYLAVLARARVFVSGDTGPLHFAAGLKVPTVSLFAATDPVRWAPLGSIHRRVGGGPCHCSGHAHVCYAPEPCMRRVGVDSVWQALLSCLQSP